MDKAIKVMHVMRPVQGGMRQHLIGLLSQVNQSGIKTVVICAQGENGFQPSELPGTEIIPLDIKGDFNFRSDQKVAREILRIARREKVNLIHAHGIKAGLLCLWASLNCHNDFAIVCTFHNQFRKVANPLKNRFNQFLVTTLANQINHIITVSLAIRKELVGFQKIHPHKITCIYNGVDLSKLEGIKSTGCLHREFEIPPRSIVIGTVARLIPQKGISTLIKAAVKLQARNPNLFFVVIGDGPFRQTLELEVAGYGLKRQVAFTGYRTNIPELLAELDIFVLPTLEEGFSIVTLEAMAVKKPVIASKVGGLPEVLGSDSGLTVRPGNVADLENALQELINNPAKREAMGEAAINRVREHFTLSRMAEKHLRLYRELTKGLNGN